MIQPDFYKQNILYWNCASGIFNKASLIKNKLIEHKPEIFFIAESDLNNAMNLNLLNHLGYNLHTSQTITNERKSRLCSYSKPGWNLANNHMSKNDEIIILKKK